MVLSRLYGDFIDWKRRTLVQNKPTEIGGDNELCNGRAALRALAVAAALCSATAFSTQAAHAAPDAHFVLISHAPDSDSWWNTIKNAIKQADEDFNVETDYRNPPNGDISGHGAADRTGGGTQL